MVLGGTGRRFPFRTDRQSSRQKINRERTKIENRVIASLLPSRRHCHSFCFLQATKETMAHPTGNVIDRKQPKHKCVTELAEEKTKKRKLSDLDDFFTILDDLLAFLDTTDGSIYKGTMDLTDYLDDFLAILDSRNDGSVFDRRTMDELTDLCYSLAIFDDDDDSDKAFHLSDLDNIVVFEDNNEGALLDGTMDDLTDLCDFLAVLDNNTDLDEGVSEKYIAPKYGSQPDATISPPVLSHRDIAYLHYVYRMVALMKRHVTVHVTIPGMKRRPGDRGKDKKPRKGRRCHQCIKKGRQEAAVACKGRWGQTKCEYQGSEVECSKTGNSYM